MHSKEVWDSVYNKSSSKIAWGEDCWTNWCIEILSKYIKNKGKLLDYGCGTGTIAEHFHKLGYEVELAELSDIMVQKLKEKFNIPVYSVLSPQDISKRNYYDYIISMGVFQHIDPIYWPNFLSEFHNQLKENGLLIITGWDEKDDILNTEGVSRFTHKKIWGINLLEKYVVENRFKIEASGTKLLKMKTYPNGRLFRYFVFKKG